MSKLSKKIPSFLGIFAVLTAFLCCTTHPVWAQGVNATGAQIGYAPRPTVTGSDGIAIPVDNFGGSLNSNGTCVFSEKPELYYEWGTDVDSGVETVPWTPGNSAPLADRVAVREQTNLFGESTDWGCPVFQMTDSGGGGAPLVWGEPLSQCEGFYKTVDTLTSTEAGLKTTGEIAATVDQNPDVVCCHLRREERLPCYAKTKAGQMAIQAAQKQMGSDLKVVTKGMTPEEQSQIIDLKKQVKDAANSCWEAKYKKVQKYFQTRKINSCIKAVKNYFKTQTKQLKTLVTDEAATDLTKEGGGVDGPTVGTAASPGNLPGKAVAMVVLGAKGGVKLATTLGHIAGAIEVLLSECASIATDFSNIEGIVKGISDQLCEATLGLVERQLTQCIRIDVSFDLSLPKFSIMTQCPFNISLNLRVSPSGITCIGNVSGQQAVNVGVSGSGSGGMNAGNSSATYTGDNMYTFLAGATNGADVAGSGQQGLNDAESWLAGALFSGSSDCFKPAAVMNAAGLTETMDSTGNFTNSAQAAQPRMPGVDCAGDLNSLVRNATAPIHGTTYLPPAPMPPSGMGWSASTVVDTGFPSAVPAWANQVSRCDFYAMGRLQRTAYVFGGGGDTMCQGDFMRDGSEIMTSCYTNGYVPVEKSPIPEACMYRQGNPQPCLLEDLSALDPIKLSQQGNGTPAGNGTTTVPSSVVIAVGNSGQLIPQVSNQYSGTVMTNGNVLTNSVPLTGTLGNFAPMRRQADDVTFSSQGQQQPNNLLEAEEILTRGDVVDMATSQDGCARGYASHDYIGNDLIARRYPLSTPITNPDGTQIFTGQCSDYSTTAADPVCCDPQVQNCTKPPFASMPICACDQGDRTASLIPARDPADLSQILYEKNPDGTTSTRPIYACVDKDNRLIANAIRTCCNAKLNGEGAEGCGSPLGVGTAGPLADITAQELKGAVQTRAQNADLQADGYLFTNEIPLPRCQDDAGMCVKESTPTGQNIIKPRNSPYKYLVVRPDKTVTALNGKKKQCCTSKWCNVCPQAYAGAYGLVQRETTRIPWGSGVYSYEDYRSGRGDEYPGNGIPDFDASTPFRSDQDLIGTSDEWRRWGERAWNMGLFRDGWPFYQLQFGPEDGESGQYPDNRVWFTGAAAYAGIMRSSTDYTRLYGPNGTVISPTTPINTDDFGGRCGKSLLGEGNISTNPAVGLPCAFPSFSVNKSIPKIQPRALEEECSGMAAEGDFSSWRVLKNRLNAGQYDAGLGVMGKRLWEFLGGGTMNDVGNRYRALMREGPQPAGAAEGAWGGWARWGQEYKELGSAWRRNSTVYKTLSGSSSAMKFGSMEISSVPDMVIFPLDYLNEMKAKLTGGQEFEPIELCERALPLCTDPKLEQYGAGGDSADDGTGGLGADQGSPWGTGDGNGNGDGSDGSGGSGMGGNASNPCAGITDPDALLACQNSYGGQGGSNGPEACNQITDPIAYLACLAANGFGDGSIPVECVGLTGAALMQCIRNHFGFGAGGGTGVGGTPEGGIRGGAGGYGTMTNPFGPGSGGNGGNGNTGPVRPFTGDGTGTVVPGRDDTAPVSGGTLTPGGSGSTPGGTTAPGTAGGTTGGTTTQGTGADEGLF